jgi:hypothetical protein
MKISQPSTLQAGSSQIIYRTHSFIQVLLFLLFNIGYVAGIIIALTHFNENPVVTSIVTAICFVFLLVTGSDEIILYANGIKYREGGLIGRFKKQRFYALSSIKSINVKGDYSTADELHSKGDSWVSKPYNQVVINLVNGSSVDFQTSIYLHKLKKLQEEVKYLQWQL